MNGRSEGGSQAERPRRVAWGQVFEAGILRAGLLEFLNPSFLASKKDLVLTALQGRSMWKLCAMDTPLCKFSH